MKMLRDLLAKPSVPWALALVALVLALPTLTMGVMLDDFVMRYAVEGGAFPGGPRGVWDLYRFADGGAGTRDAITMGLYPWWTSPDLKLAFFRPLASLWIALDQTVFAGKPWVAHLGNVLAYGCLGLVVARLYGRLLGGATAGLAAVLYVIDDARALPILWASNRHALVSALLGFAALHAHIKEKRAVAVALFVAALAAGESAFGAAAYFVAYAGFADPRGRAAAFRSLVPYGVVFVIWLGFYLALGYGVQGSAGYIHPSKDPLRFAVAVLERGPQIMLSQLFGPPAEMWELLPRDQQRYTPLVFVPAALGLSWLLFRSARGHRLRAFFTAGALLSIPPLCATFPADRMLVFPGFGAFGLMAIGIGRVGRARLDGHGRPVATVVAGFALFVHGVIALLLLPLREKQTDQIFSGAVARGAATIPTDPALKDQRLFVIVAPDPLMTSYMFLDRLYAAGDLPYAREGRVLGVLQKGAAIIERDGERSFALRASEGQLFGDLFSKVYRDKPFEAGETRRIGDFTATVSTLDGDGYPSAVRFDFDGPLDASFRWLVWKHRGFEEVSLPVVGQTLEVPAVDWMTAYGP
jgi:hypothetical protein